MYAAAQGLGPARRRGRLRLRPRRARLPDEVHAHAAPALRPHRRAGRAPEGHRDEVPGAPHARRRGHVRRACRAHPARSLTRCAASCWTPRAATDAARARPRRGGACSSRCTSSAATCTRSSRAAATTCAATPARSRSPAGAATRARSCSLTALREAEEEIGLRARRRRAAGRADAGADDRDELRRLSVRRADRARRHVDAVGERGRRGARAAPRATCARARTRRRLSHRGIPFRTDVYDVGEELVIWGATARIVSDLLARMRPVLDSEPAPEAMDRDGLLRSLATRVSDERVLAAIAAVPRELFVSPQLRRGRLQRRAAAHRPRADDLPADGRRADGRAARAAPDRPRARRRHRLGLPRGRPVAAVRARLGRRAAASSSRCAPRARCARAGIDNVTVDRRRRRRRPARARARSTRSTSPRRRAGEVPPALEQQLALGGRLVAPVADEEGEQLVLVRRHEGGFERLRPGAPCASFRCVSRDFSASRHPSAERCTMRYVSRGSA